MNAGWLVTYTHTFSRERGKIGGWMRELWGTLSIRKRKTTDQIGKSPCLTKEKVEDHIQEQPAYKKLWLRMGGKNTRHRITTELLIRPLKRKRLKLRIPGLLQPRIVSLKLSCYKKLWRSVTWRRHTPKKRSIIF